MTITESVRAMVTRALREKGLNHSEFASAIGVHPAWVTKFFNSKLKALSDQRMQLMEAALGIQFFRLVPGPNAIPEEAEKLGQLMKTNPEVAQIVAGLLKMADTQVIHELPYFETKELTKIGAELVRIVNAWDVPHDPHYTKIGLETVRFLSTFTAKKEKRLAKVH